MSYELVIGLALGSSQTGLTLSAQLVDTDGVNEGAAVATGFAEIGAGNYLWHYASFADGFRGGVVFSAGGLVKAFAAVNPEDAEYVADMKATLSRFVGNSAVSFLTAVSGTTITALRGDTWVFTVADLGDLTGRSKLWFTVKRDTTDEDAAAVIQVEETDGLLYANGAAASNAAHGSLVVTDEDDGDLTVTVDEAVTKLATVRRGMSYDIQVLTAGVVTTLTTGTFIVSADVTRVVS